MSIPTIPYGPDANTTDVLIIGAGLSGMVMAIEMIRKGLGRNFIIVEKGSQVGGTWNDQRYPGCCCDVWSHLYSLSFEPNPSWTREYPTQPEIHSYLIHIAHKYLLYKHIRFTTAVSSSHWNETSKTWSSTLVRLGGKDAEYGKEYHVTSKFLVSAVGQLSVPRYPEIPGLAEFKGKAMHSARWEWEIEFKGKKVGIIGNGATAAQIAPEVAKVCEELVVFQRTPNWIVPRGDKEISRWVQGVYRWVPWARKRYREKLMDLREAFFEPVFDVENMALSELSKAMLEKELPGEEYAVLREKLTPSYRVGCKRVLISDHYYPIFRRSNVHLETGRIERVTEKGVKVVGEGGGKEHDFDLLVLATGFQTTKFMYQIQIYGKEGQSIEALWKDGAKAYLGMTVPELPNFSMLYGPNTNLGHNSIILMIEAQALYTSSLISKILLSPEPLSLSPKLTITNAYNKEIQTRLQNSAFADNNCHSWYKDERTGLITNNWAGNVVEYQERTRKIEWEEYEVRGVDGVKEEKGRVQWDRVVEESKAGVVDGVVLGGLVVGAGALVLGVLGR